MTAVSSPSTAPNYALHRHVSEAVDSLPETVKTHGMNCQGYDRVSIQIVPDAAADPSVEVLFWSEKAAKFISDETPVSYASAGVGIPYEFGVDVAGRRIFVAVKLGLAAGQEMWIYAAAAPPQ